MPGGCTGDNEVLLGQIVSALKDIKLPGDDTSSLALAPPGPPVTCDYIRTTQNCPAFCFYAGFVCCDTCSCDLGSRASSQNSGVNGGNVSGCSGPDCVVQDQQTGESSLGLPLWVVVFVACVVCFCLASALCALAGGSRGLRRKLQRGGWVPPQRQPDLSLAQGTLVHEVFIFI